MNETARRGFTRPQTPTDRRRTTVNNMTVRIHYTLPDGVEDSLVLTGTLDDLRTRARAEVDARGGTDEWSEVLS